MKILILGSMSFSKEMDYISKELERLGHKPKLPEFIQDYLKMNSREKMHSAAVANKNNYDLFKKYYEMIKENDAVLIVNKDKNNIKNYIGGNALIEMSFAHLLDKKVFLLNPIPDMIYTDEIKALNPKILGEDLSLINEPEKLEAPKSNK